MTMVEPSDIWGKLATVVKEDRFMSATDEFLALKNMILKQDPADLVQQSDKAKVTWEFLVGFAEKKPLYRSHIKNVIQALAAVQSWRMAYAALPELHAKVSKLHSDLQAAWDFQGQSPENEPKSSLMVPPPSAPESHKLARWPDWATVESSVATGGFNSSGDLFSTLSNAVKDASAQDLVAESLHAGLVWEFIIGFASANSKYIACITDVVETLMAAPAWRSVWATRGDLQLQALALHEDLQKALQLASVGPGGPQSGAPAGSTADGGATPRLPDRSPAMEGTAAAAQPVESGAMAGPSDPAARLVQPYLQRAAELEASEPLVAHYCRVHAVELLVRSQRERGGKTSAESRAFLNEVLKQAEAGKKKVQQQFDLFGGQRTMEVFALRFFRNATAADRAGPPNSSIPQQLYLAGLFIDVLAQFHSGSLPPALAHASQYAKSRAVHIRSCLQRNIDPDPPMPPSLGDDLVTKESSLVRPALAPVPVVKPPVVAAAVAPTLASAPQATVGSAWSGAKRKVEARKKASLAISSIEADDAHAACKNIREALALLDGLG